MDPGRIAEQAQSPCAVIATWRSPCKCPSSALFLVALLTGCGGGGASGDTGGTTTTLGPSAPDSSATAANQIKALEANGTLPKLDRSASIPGPDKDSNQVRDDIDTIVSAKPDTASQKTALAQLATSLTGTITADSTQPAQVRAAAQAMADAVSCMYERYDTTTASRRVRELEMFTMNTPARLQAYLTFSAALQGESMQIRDGGCHA
jgi:hypothetical protein